MASDINRVILIGRLVRDPELKSTNGGSYLCRFTLASNRSTYNRETKESKDNVGFFPCTVWGKQAETVNKYVTKGQRICVEGHLQFSSWEDKDGKKRSDVSVSVESFQFLEKKNGEHTDQPSGGAAHYDEGGMKGDDDIPF